ncbi:EAL domain-containing response regulator [Achromobacter aloeverae]|uniref:EAL domain-containing response regulator n=1 Tax=Achromobacter aloeverae TaxID=1750518 RepID=UPI001F01F952|nr:EAL domain-containing response regulator [Achromobacter aloeverae]
MLPTLRSILVVDDSLYQRRHTASLCRDLGIASVHEAGDGEEALAVLDTLRPLPQVIVVDIEMRGMDGVELIEQLRIRNTLVDLVIASGRESAMIDSVVAIALDMGFNVLAGLEKPVTREALGHALDTYGVAARPRRGAGTEEEQGREQEQAPPIPPGMLEAALTQGQVHVEYQPKVDMNTGLVRGVEALARWRHPRLGDVPPARFIPLAEQYGLIQPLTFAVMEQALAQMASWNSRGLRLTLSINLSPLLLDWPGLVHDIMAVVHRFQVPTEQVSFEITESSLVDPGGHARGLLARLRLRGFGLSIDDYGTGFSSMQQLARIPFTELKIDRSFVHGAIKRKNLRVILKAAIDMAQQMGLVSTAEGIETEEDWQLLRELGCMVGQGYFIARPMAGSGIPGWLRQHRHRVDGLREGLGRPVRGARQAGDVVAP